MTNSTSLPFNYGGRQYDDLRDIRDDHYRKEDHYRDAMDETRMRSRGGDDMRRKTNKRYRRGGRTHKRRYDKMDGGRLRRRDKRMRTYRR